MADKTDATDAYWRDYLEHAGLAADDYAVCSFGDNPHDAAELAALVLAGTKRATASLARDYPPDGLPRPGDYVVVVDGEERPCCIWRTLQIEVKPMREVDAAFAWDEGEGDRTLPDWMDGHRRFFTHELATMGGRFDESMRVDLERFELLYPFEAALNPVDCGPRILPCLVPGALSASAALQTQYYAREHSFGVFFESGRMADIAEFLARYDALRDGAWVAADRGHVLGTIVIDGGANPDPSCAQLRWFVMADALRGRGFGRQLMNTALQFARARYARVRLGTFAGLDAARHLYEHFGFRKVHEAPATTWGPEVLEQHWEWTS